MSTLSPYACCVWLSAFSEVDTVFRRAIQRQSTWDKSYTSTSVRRTAVVFMDEAGLPEDAKESLKVLHYYLDNPDVAFVAITNRPLDAAKMNRFVHARVCMFFMCIGCAGNRGCACPSGAVLWCCSGLRQTSQSWACCSRDLWVGVLKLSTTPQWSRFAPRTTRL